MTQKIYQVDAFTDKVFSGNPAAVCPLDSWLSEEKMLQIAAENNLAETVFYVTQGEIFEIRWFTPTIEVDLCGHATLAAAYVIFNIDHYHQNNIEFFSPRSGKLTVMKNDNLLTLNFPTDIINEVTITKEFTECFDISPIELYRGKTDYLYIFSEEEDILNIIPYFDKIEKLDCRGVIISAKGNAVDLVSRFFGPQSGVKEDPVTGSAHTTLIPYWSKQLSKISLSAIQLSHRRGHLQCRYLGDRVEISGKAQLYLAGEIFIH